MSDKKVKPKSRIEDVFASSAELGEEVVFAPKPKPPVPVNEPPTPAGTSSQPPTAEAPAEPAREKAGRAGKRKGRVGRPPKGEKRPEADRDVVVSSIRLEPDLLERMNAYVGNRYALFNTKADLVRHAVIKALDELEPILKKAEKLYAAHLGTGKGGKEDAAGQD